MLDFSPSSNGTNINNALEYLTRVIKKHCATFLISDFIDQSDYYKSLSIANHKHDVTGIQVYDKREAQLPNVGLMKVVDSESGVEQWINTSSSKVRQVYNKWWYERQLFMNETARRCAVDLVSVATDEDYVKALKGLFKKRAIR